MFRTISTKITFFVFAIFFCFCNSQQPQIPDVYVNITLDLNKPDYVNLRAVGNYVYITGGVSGIIVYRDGINEFLAYDRACAYDPHCGRVFANSDASRLVDTICCKSEFSISNGSPVKGEAKTYLKKYQTFYNSNTNTLLITN